jgi:hypothetical protein
LVDDGCGASGAKERRLVIGLHSNVMLVVVVVIVVVVVVGYRHFSCCRCRMMMNGGSTVWDLLDVFHHWVFSHPKNFN